MGILRSVDAGETWTKSLDWSYDQKRGVQRVKFNPFDDNTVWAATTEGTYKSYNQGETWQLVHDVVMATDIAINPIDSNIVFLACGGMWSNGNGVYRSIDAGVNWEKMDFAAVGGPSQFGGKARIAISQDDPEKIYVSIGNSNSSSGSATWLCKSINNGDDWEIVSTVDYSTYQGWYSHFVGVSPFDSDKIVCGGVHMYQSDDGGETLVESEGTISNWFDPDWLHLDHHDIEYHPTDPNVFYSANDGGVFRTDDGGETFYSCNWGFQTSQFYPGFSNSDTDSLFAVGGMQDNFSAVYEGDKNWRRVNGGDGAWSAINQLDNSTLYCSSQYLNIGRSRNTGINFTNVRPSTAYGTFISPFILSPIDNLTIYAASTKVYRSSNEGTDWDVICNSNTLNNNPVLTMGVSSSDIDKVYIATIPGNGVKSKVFKNLDSSNNWIDISGDNFPDRYITDIYVDTNNDDIVYITFGGFESSHLFRTIDGGDNWTDIGVGLPDIPAWSVVTDPEFPEHIYFGNEFGVYLSTDNGDNWEEFTEGLGDGAFAMDLTISKLNRSLRVASHGNGIFQRKLVGIVNGIDDGSDNSISKNFILNQNYPNPFNNSTNISFKLLKENMKVSLVIFNSVGKRIETLIDDKLYSNKGDFSVMLDAAKLSTGSYIYKLTVDGVISSRRMNFVK